MRIAVATEADRSDLVRMARAMHAESPAYSGRPVVAWMLLERIAERIGEGAVFLAISGGDPVGFAIGVAWPEWFSGAMLGGELAVYVTPEHRGGSAGRRLIAALEDWARAQGCVEMHLGVSAGIDDERALAFYARLGYEPAGRSVKRAL